ncbi:MAG: hypothetical protein ABIK86_07340, partial [candidate division WOR-3 bacterium]
MTILLLLCLTSQNIERVSTAVLSGADRKLVVDGTRLYSACERGLDIFDITEPESIRLLGYCNTPGFAYGCAVQDSIVFVADNFNGLEVLDVADPARPHELGRYPMASIEDVVVKDTFAFCGSNDLAVLSIADLARPRRLGLLSGVGIKRMALKDTLLFVATQTGLKVLSVASPQSPRQVASIEASWLRDVTVQGNYVYTCGDTELLIYDATTLARVGRYDGGYLAFGLAVKDSLAFLCRGQNMDVRIVNVANPAMPVYRGQFTCQNGPQSAAVSGHYVFAGVWSRDLLVADFTNPAAPVVRGRFKRPGEINDAWRNGNLVVTADRWYGVTVVDVTDIEHPVELGELVLSGYPRRVVVRDSLAFVANYDGLAIVSLANPARPALLAQTTTSYYTYKVTVKDTFAYVAEREWNPYHGTLLVYGLSDPRQPHLLGSYSTNGGGVEAVAHPVGRYCYVVSQGWSLNEFAIISVEDPRAPRRVSGLAINGYPIDVDAAGEYCYALVTSPNQRIEVISVADTLQPGLVATVGLTNSPRALYVRAPYLFVSYYYHGIEVFDISNPAAPRSIATCDLPGSAQGLYCDDQWYIYVGDSHSVELLRLVPTGITAETSRAGKRCNATLCRNQVKLTPGKVDVVDATGRKVMTGRVIQDGTLDISRLPPGV